MIVVASTTLTGVPPTIVTDAPVTSNVAIDGVKPGNLFHSVT